MERRKTPRKEWVIGKDETGRAVLEWKADSRRAGRQEADPCARTYDFLERLEVPNLELEDDGGRRSAAAGWNPYDHSPPALSKRNSRH